MIILDRKNVAKRSIVAILCTLVIVLSSVLQAQPPVKISWTAELNGDYCVLDSVVVKNQKGVKCVFYYPDTTLVSSNEVGIIPVKPETETSLKVYPNPFSDKVQVEFSLVYSGEADMVVYDMLGREIVRQRSDLDAGAHCFNLSLPAGMYALSLQTETDMQSVRLVSQGSKNTPPQLLYAGIVPSTNAPPNQMQKADEAFHEGDTLIMQAFIGDNTAAIPSLKEHMVLLTKDTHIVFTFSDACYCIMDTLKGEWIWIKFEGGWGYQIKDSTFTSVLKILSQNADYSINYEVWAEDTLFYQGSCRIEQVNLYCYTGRGIDIKLAHANLPFYAPQESPQVWGLRFTDTLLRFWDGYADGLSFYYKKIK